MPEPAQKSGNGAQGGWLRPLQAIELAEGALLADIALVFHLLIRYLPIGATVLALLIPVVFAVIVLRHGLYVGCLSLCVALCLCGMVLGPGGLPLFLLEAGAGLFLGISMRQRLNQWLTVVLGILSGGLSFWLLLLGLIFLLGGPQVLLRTIRQTYMALTSLIGLLARLFGLGSLWEERLLPLLNSWMQWGLQHWPVLLLLVSISLCIPLVVMVYAVVNTLVRLLGYRVRPFPGAWLPRLLSWLLVCLCQLLPRRAYLRFPPLRDLRRRARLVRLAALRQRRAEKGAGEHL